MVISIFKPSAMLFPGDAADKKIGVRSGGEQGRVLLGKVIAKLRKKANQLTIKKNSPMSVIDSTIAPSQALNMIQSQEVDSMSVGFSSHAFENIFKLCVIYMSKTMECTHKEAIKLIEERTKLLEETKHLPALHYAQHTHPLGEERSIGGPPDKVIKQLKAALAFRQSDHMRLGDPWKFLFGDCELKLYASIWSLPVVASAYTVPSDNVAILPNPIAFKPER